MKLTEKYIGTTRLSVMNAVGGCSVTLTTAHSYAGNIISPREGFREMGVMITYES